MTTCPLRFRLVYFAPADIQIARVDRNCIVKFCEAMAMIGCDVHLVSARIRPVPTEPTVTRRIWDVYGVQHTFDLRSIRLPLRQQHMGTRMSAALLSAARAVTYPVLAAHILWRHRRSGQTGVLYTKNYGVLLGLAFVRRLLPGKTMVFFEAHRPPTTPLQRRCLGLADGLICNGDALREALLKQGAVTPTRSIALHQGFSENAYPAGEHRESWRAARGRLGWSELDKIVVYTGKLEDVEIGMLLEATSLLAQDGIRLVVVGGRADHVQHWREHTKVRLIDNASFVGFVPPAEIADYQVAADVLVSYYPSSIPTKDYLSPGKLFEYMASGTPAVVADHQSLREVLVDGVNTLLVEPDKPGLLASAVLHVMMNTALASRLGDRARQDASRYTWTARAEDFCRFVEELGRL